MEGLTDLIGPMKATGAEVFVTGDFNVNFRRDRVLKTKIFPYATMAALGLRASYESLWEPRIGTHGGGTRLIDYVFSLPQNTVTPASQTVLRGYGSDHRPVKVDFEFTAAP
jgi:endonuclease/exonuclease/phosphatase (EEP) superfamily protein YafD